MAYRLKRNDSSVGHAVRRIADAEIVKALAALDRPDRAEAVHAVRTRCKKLRGLIRLVRPAFPAYAEENAAFRDAARAVSGARDARVMQDTYDLLMAEFAEQVERRAMGSIRRRFTLEYSAHSSEGEIGRGLGEARERLEQARKRAADWGFEADGWPALEGGLIKTYRRARRAAEQIRSCPSDALFHELRKRIKYHWFHCRLLEGLSPEMMSLRKQAAKRVAGLLGDHHDLAVFAARLAEDPQAFGSPREVEAAIGLARARQQRLAGEAAPLLDRLLAQSPGRFAGHLELLWRDWREHR
jgi:CHAD domain-containing protein